MAQSQERITAPNAKLQKSRSGFGHRAQAAIIVGEVASLLPSATIVAKKAGIKASNVYPLPAEKRRSGKDLAACVVLADVPKLTLEVRPTGPDALSLMLQSIAVGILQSWPKKWRKQLLENLQGGGIQLTESARENISFRGNGMKDLGRSLVKQLACVREGISPLKTGRVSVAILSRAAADGLTNGGAPPFRIDTTAPPSKAAFLQSLGLTSVTAASSSANGDAASGVEVSDGDAPRMGRPFSTVQADQTLTTAPNVDLTTVRSAMRTAAAASAMTLEEIGLRMGYGQSSARTKVSRLLNTNETYNPTLETVLAFAAALQVSPAEFF